MVVSTGRVVGSWHAAWLRVEGSWAWYRRYWKSNLYSSGLQPLLFLVAMGLGFGSQVRAGPATGGLPYLQYIAPALLVSAAMQNAVGESTYPVLSGFKWQKDYLAVTATPISPGQLLGGHFLWVALRLSLASAVYALIAVPFGGWLNAGAVVVVLVGVGTGLACAAPVTAFAASTYDEGVRFNALFRFVVMPMTLFAGTFFPIGQIPLALRWLAWISPLWHGNQLARGATLGGVPGWEMLGHVAFLLALFAVGAYFARRSFYRRLVV
ncbi:lipooligosaccharide transport system permease protein [Amycolatopsis bartoniae]|uniref:Transport permease protein n=1 Tax=Amycolatopsis bartoniae TaxID=941986 RepID=A0A8H9M636_9PSEU|nr:ABC transporter permease [Amycolatopsis bartoniae]MBB2935790.1 lipooligosaccharide transport system permease protein [Amycolatopsis bartoniae]TVT00288.1 ABC transporter permease [Amycolatopsis bartoniae]GHF61880.1 transport permease protein [Amycolatopsis bartoniae]